MSVWTRVTSDTQSDRSVGDARWKSRDRVRRSWPRPWSSVPQPSPATLPTSRSASSPPRYRLVTVPRREWHPNCYGLAPAELSAGSPPPGVGDVSQPALQPIQIYNFYFLLTVTIADATGCDAACTGNADST